MATRSKGCNRVAGDGVRIAFVPGKAGGCGVVRQNWGRHFAARQSLTADGGRASYRQIAFTWSATRRGRYRLRRRAARDGCADGAAVPRTRQVWALTPPAARSGDAVRRVLISRSTYGFCQGLAGAETTSAMPVGCDNSIQAVKRTPRAGR